MSVYDERGTPVFLRYVRKSSVFFVLKKIGAFDLSRLMPRTSRQLTNRNFNSSLVKVTPHEFRVCSVRRSGSGCWNTSADKWPHPARSCFPCTPNPKFETRNPKPEIRNSKPETRNPETRNPKLETRNPKPRNPKPETRNPETRNPKSETETRNPKVGPYNLEPRT